MCWPLEGLQVLQIRESGDAHGRTLLLSEAPDVISNGADITLGCCSHFV